MKVWKSLRPRIKPVLYRYRSGLLYRLANFYINAVDNDNDCDFVTNGEKRFARERLENASCVFDVGAALGNWTQIALDANPSLRVHCFEPCARRFAILSSRDFGDRAIRNQLALGDKSGTKTIFYGASGGSNSFFPQRYQGETYKAEDQETVTVTTLDDYCAERAITSIDFLKMDIEGYEMTALQGAKRLLEDGRIGVIQFEYSDVFLDAGSSLLELMSYVRDINPRYEFHKIYPDETRRVDAYNHKLDNFKTQNWAIILST